MHILPIRQRLYLRFSLTNYQNLLSKSILRIFLVFLATLLLLYGVGVLMRNVYVEYGLFNCWALEQC